MSRLHFDDEPSRWFVERTDPVDLASAINLEAERIERTRFNATAWIAAAGGVATVIGGVIAFGFAAACVFSRLG